MTDINLQTLTPDTTLPTTGFLFGADSQASGSPSVFTVQSVATTLLGSTTLTGAAGLTADAPVLNLAQTWNNAAVTFTGLKLNVTDTASAAGSLLMDLQVGGASRFSVSKAGKVTSANDVQILNSNGLLLNSLGGYILFGLSNDLILTRRGTANLRFGAADAAAPVAQTLSVQSVVAGTTNTAGTNLTITGSQGTGSGAGGSIIFQVAPAGSSGTAQNALRSAITLNSAGTLAIDHTGITNVASLNITSGGGGPVIYIGSLDFSLGFTGAGRFLRSVNLALDVNVAGTGILSLTTGSDIILCAPFANIFEQRRGANAQTFNLYGTYTDASNYRRAALAMTTAGVATLKPEGAGTGASGNVLHISGLPTSNPGPGILWNNAGTPAIGT